MPNNQVKSKQRVKATGNIEAIQKANELINFLGSKGFIEFRELL
ncbi:MAG: hypothetical protein PHR47_00095 [Candidatus Pacebacteria bacterium]|nr:hypothetical protein [Candidatus Paceibacterota bacterium]